jgi:uncharacterized protein with PIN domain
MSRDVGHPDRLNRSDYLVYAATKSANAPPLFIGGDSTHTDIISVLDDLRPTTR